MQKAILSCLIPVMVLMTANLGRADEVRLKNGDRLTGTVVGMSDETLIFETTYAGEVKIKWSQVAELNSRAPIRMLLEDDSRLKGTIVGAGDGRLKLNTEAFDMPMVFELTDVKAINPKYAPPVQISARANAGISVEKGNTDAENYRFDGEFTARTIMSRYRVGGEWNHEKSEDVSTVKNWLAYADYRYFLNPKWFLLVNTLLENDDFADLDLRTTLGGGGGYQFFESADLKLSVELGAAYVNENYFLGEDDSFAASQWGVDYEQHFFNNAIQLFHRNFGYWSLEDSQDWVIKTRQGIRHPIYKGFNVTLQYNYDYDNQPSPGAKTDYDWKLMFLLGYQFDQ